MRRILNFKDCKLKNMALKNMIHIKSNGTDNTREHKWIEFSKGSS